MSEFYNDEVEVMESAEVSEVTEVEVDEDTETTEEEQAEPFDWSGMELKHLKDVKKLSDYTPEDAKAYFQKGLDYDRVKGQIDSYRANPLYQYIDNHMKQSGYSDPVEYVKAIETSALTSDYLNQGYDDETAVVLANKDIALKYASTRDPMAGKIDEMLSWHADKVKQGVFDTDLTPETVPHEVTEAIRNGASPKEAYMDWAISNIKVQTEQKTIKSIAKNKQTSTGSVNTHSKSDGQLSVTQIEKTLGDMNSDERRQWITKNYDMVVKSGYFK